MNSNQIQRYALVGAWALVIVIFAVFGPSVFFTWGNFTNIFGYQAVAVLLTFGLLIPPTAGDYDRSVAFSLTLSSMLVALLNVNEHWAIVPAILVALACGVAV